MQVSIKKFNVDMQVKNNGIEFQVNSPAGEQLGDCYITKTGLIWCEGKTKKENGQKVSWQKFIQWMNDGA